MSKAKEGFQFCYALLSDRGKGIYRNPISLCKALYISETKQAFSLQLRTNCNIWGLVKKRGHELWDGNDQGLVVIDFVSLYCDVGQPQPREERLQEAWKLRLRCSVNKAIQLIHDEKKHFMVIAKRKTRERRIWRIYELISLGPGFLI